MGLTFDDIAALPNGARFVRADLHIHSIASTEDVARDSGMTAEAIIDASLSAGLEIISITDHNTIDALPDALRYAAQFAGRLLFIPGVEITTNEGHLLVYFSPVEFESLERFMHRLSVVRDDQGSRVQASMIDVLRAATALGGICVAAHIDTAIGFEVRNPGYPAWKKDLLKEPGLRGLEFRYPENVAWYSIDDTSTTPEANERRKYAQARIDVALRANGALARFHNSDAHEFQKLIKPSALTRIKVTDLTFEAFRAALADPEARVKINELLPPSIPRIIGLGINGGFLDGTAIRFADNLNIFFGGRGTGKSTAIRAIAFALGREDFKDIDSPFQNVSLFCDDGAGVEYRFDRAAGGDVIGRLRKAGSVVAVPPEMFPIEYYGQGELGRVAQQSLSDAAALQDFLDRHIPFGSQVEWELQLAGDARDIARQLAPLKEVQASKKPLMEQLSALEVRLKESEGSKIKQVAEFQNRLTAEKSLRTNFVELVGLYRRGISLRNLIREPRELKDLSRVETYGKSTVEAFDAIEREIDATNDYLAKKAREINETLQSAASTIAARVAEVDQHHIKAADQVQQYVDQLREKGLASSIAELNDFSRRKGALVGQIARIDAQRASFEELNARFLENLNELDTVRIDIDRLRSEQRDELNRGFNRDKYGRFEVLLIPDGGYAAREYDEYLAHRLEGSYFQSESISKVRDLIAPRDLADLLESENLAALSAIEAIGPKWAPIFVQRLGSPDSTLYLRTLRRQRAPRFKVIERATGTEISFSHLSDGQKHTVMLTVALLAGSRHPLVIDQPEDDLDNKFIAERVVKTLRDVKEARQVILVTHNANIAVLGDSEEMLAMEHDDAGGGRVASSGSIDDPITKAAVQDCLEGGVLALRRRFDVYGI